MSRRVAALAVVFVVMTALTTACGSRVRDWPDTAAAPLVTEVDQVDDATDGATGTTPPTSATNSVTASTRPGASASAATSTALPAPAPGRYVYDETADAPAIGDEPASSDKAVITARWTVSATSSQVMSQSAETSDQDEPGDASQIEKFLTTGSAFSMVSTGTSDPDDSSCNYAPALLLLQLPLHTGATWRASATCDYGDGETEKLATEARVTGEATDTIGGKPVHTFVVATTVTYTDTYPSDDPEDPGAQTETYTVKRTTHVDPSTLLAVIDELTNTVDTFTFTDRRVLRSLTPAA